MEREGESDLIPLIFFFFEHYFGIRFFKRGKSNTGEVLVSISIAKLEEKN